MRAEKGKMSRQVRQFICYRVLNTSLQQTGETLARLAQGPPGCENRR